MIMFNKSLSIFWNNNFNEQKIKQFNNIIFQTIVFQKNSESFTIHFDNLVIISKIFKQRSKYKISSKIGNEPY